MTDLQKRNFITECKGKLILKKSDILNNLQRIRADFVEQKADTSGDEVDQSMHQLNEHQFLTTSERLRGQLLEIENALMRIEQGNYGVCEETQEPIEEKRLLTIPWTRLSIEGAEIRDALKTKYAFK